VRFIRHKDIEKQKWDRLVHEFGDSKLYILSWYLDAACPSWDAIVWGDYEAIIPLPTKKWWILKKVYQPFFVQQTGIIHQPYLQINVLLNNLLTSGFLKSYFSFRVQLNILLPTNFNSSNQKKWQVEKKKNFVLTLDRDYVTLRSNYNENRKRNIKKAISESWSVNTSLEIDSAIEMYKKNQAPKQKQLGLDVYKVLKRIFNAVNQNGSRELLICKDEKGMILSYAFFVNTPNRIYYLFGTMSVEGRKHSAISLLFDDIIKRNSNSNKKLDFEGGNLESIGRFFASFGAMEEEYSCIWK